MLKGKGETASEMGDVRLREMDVHRVDTRTTTGADYYSVLISERINLRVEARVAGEIHARAPVGEASGGTEDTVLPIGILM
jgi:hypothetical protein